MPCNVCHYFYMDEPCSKKEMSLIDPVVAHNSRVDYSDSAVESLGRVYNILRENCICDACLVKVVCQAICQEFQDSIKPLRIIGS